MEDLPKPVWDLLAQKIDDARTWFSFVQVSRLARFLGKKYKKEKQDKFGKFEYTGLSAGNHTIITCKEKVMPNGKMLDDYDMISFKRWVFDSFVAKPYSIYVSRSFKRSEITYIYKCRLTHCRVSPDSVYKRLVSRINSPNCNIHFKIGDTDENYIITAYNGRVNFTIETRGISLSMRIIS